MALKSIEWGFLKGEDSLSFQILFCIAWQAHEAIRFVNMVSDLDIYLEEPCADPEATRAVRAHANVPLISDETTKDVLTVGALYKDHQADVLSLKFDRLGGISRAKVVSTVWIYYFIEHKNRKPDLGRLS